MNDWLLKIIRCPITGQSLRLADDTLVSRLRSQRQSGTLFSHKGIAISDDFQSGLVSDNVEYFYRIQDDIPSLLPDEAVKL